MDCICIVLIHFMARSQIEKLLLRFIISKVAIKKERNSYRLVIKKGTKLAQFFNKHSKK